MPDRSLDVYPLPSLEVEKELIGRAVVVIDLLRATSTICQALASGASEVVPFLEVPEARAAKAAAADRDRVLLGGERGGKLIEGFDLGNSPLEYTDDVVGDRRVFLTTTNGTRALTLARVARRVVAGAFLNFSAVVACVAVESSVGILCAGTEGKVTRDDLLAAGAFVDGLCKFNAERWKLNSDAESARRDWLSLVGAARVADVPVRDYLATVLQDTAGGRNLLSIGMDRDLVACAQIDELAVVPELNVAEWRIRAV
jgi:2-phosphosulfolactate phosphatase